MKPIVVPVNFTPNSANAARYAADLALSIGAEVNLLYIFLVPMSMSEVPMPETTFEGMLASGQEMLDHLKHELERRTRGKVPVHTYMDTGTVEGRIESFCQQKEPILVVMGATGKGLENALTGSSSVRAVRHLPYPVLVVPEDAHFRSIRHVVVACDEEDLSAGLPVATPVLQVLGEIPEIRLEVVHVITGDEPASEFINAYNIWKNQLKGLQPELHFVRAAHVAEGVNDYLAESPADLLLVFPKKHDLFEFHQSQAKRLVLHCGVPVMSVHE